MNKYSLNEFRVGYHSGSNGFSSYFFTTAKLNGPNICICRKPDGHNFVMVYNESSLEHCRFPDKDYFESKSKPEDYQSIDEMFPDGLSSKLSEWECKFLDLYLQYGIDIVDHLPEGFYWGMPLTRPWFYLITSYPNGLEDQVCAKSVGKKKIEKRSSGVKINDYLMDKLKEFECRIVYEFYGQSYIIFTLGDLEILSADSRYVLITHLEYNNHGSQCALRTPDLDPWNQEVLESYFKYGEDEFLNHLPEKSELEYEQNDSSKIKLIKYNK